MPTRIGAALLPTDGGEQAIRELEKAALALEPTSVKSPVQSGDSLRREPEIWFRQGDRAAAEKVIATSPAFARAHLALGKAPCRTEKYRRTVNFRKRGIVSIRRAVKLTISWAGQRRELGERMRNSRTPEGA